MPEINKEPDFLGYMDRAFTINWWPHQLYRRDHDLVIRHRQFAKVRHDNSHDCYIWENYNKRNNYNKHLKSFLHRKEWRRALRRTVNLQERIDDLKWDSNAGKF